MQVVSFPLLFLSMFLLGSIWSLGEIFGLVVLSALQQRGFLDLPRLVKGWFAKSDKAKADTRNTAAELDELYYNILEMDSKWQCDHKELSDRERAQMGEDMECDWCYLYTRAQEYQGHQQKLGKRVGDVSSKSRQ